MPPGGRRRRTHGHGRRQRASSGSSSSLPARRPKAAPAGGDAKRGRKRSRSSSSSSSRSGDQASRKRSGSRKRRGTGRRGGRGDTGKRGDTGRRGDAGGDTGKRGDAAGKRGGSRKRSRKRSGSGRRSGSRRAGEDALSRIWRRIERLKLRSEASSSESEDSRRRGEVKALRERFSSMVKKARRREALGVATRILDSGGKIDQGALREFLEMSARKPSATVFAAVLIVCVLAKLKLTVNEFARVIGIMVQRGAPVAQIRAALNLVVPRGDAAIALVPPGLEPEEVSAVYQDEAPDEDSEAEEEADKSNMTREAPPERLEMVSCKALRVRLGVRVRGSLERPGRT